MPCGGSVKKIASYLVCMVIVAMLLLLNNFVLLYVQNSRRSNAVYTLEGKWPSIEHTKVMDPSLDIHDGKLDTRHWLKSIDIINVII